MSEDEELVRDIERTLSALDGHSDTEAYYREMAMDIIATVRAHDAEQQRP